MKRALIVTGTVVVIFILGIALIVPMVRVANAAATHSVAAQLLQNLRSHQDSVEIEVRDEWQLLSDLQYDRLLAALKSKGLSFDACPHCYTSDGIVGDAWGRRLNIAARRNEGGELDFMIWSNGPDGQSKTSDDILVPESGQGSRMNEGV